MGIYKSPNLSPIIVLTNKDVILLIIRFKSSQNISLILAPVHQNPYQEINRPLHFHSTGRSTATHDFVIQLGSTKRDREVSTALTRDHLNWNGWSSRDSFPSLLSVSRCLKAKIRLWANDFCENTLTWKSLISRRIQTRSKSLWFFFSYQTRPPQFCLKPRFAIWVNFRNLSWDTDDDSNVE